MGKKTHIVAALGEQSLLVPALLSEALAANDRAKYRLTLLQTAKAHADFPDAGCSTLQAERLACDIRDAGLDDVVLASSRQGEDRYAIPWAGNICAGLGADLDA